MVVTKYAKHMPLLFLVLVMAISFLLCTVRIEKYFYGYDERATLSCAYGFHFGYEKNITYFTQSYFDSYYSIDGVVKATIADNGNAIAYNLLLHLWTYLAGVDAFLLHLPSILFFVFSIPLFYGIVKRLVQNNTVLYISVLFFSIHPYFIYMARQIRGYSMSLFLTMLSTYLLLKYIEKKEHDWGIFLLYTLAISVLPLTHYLFGSLIIAHLILVCYLCFKSDLSWTKSYFILLSLLSCIGFVVCWLFIGGWEAYTHDLSRGLKSWLDHPATFIRYSVSNVASYWSNLLIFSEGFTLQYLGIRIRNFAPLTILFLGLIYLGYTSKEMFSKLKLLAIVIPVIIFSSNFILSLRSGILISFYPKYNIILMPFIILFSVAGIVYLYRRSRILGYGIVMFYLMIYAWCYLDVIYFDQLRLYGGSENVIARNQSPYPNIAKSIESNYSKGDTLVFSSWEHASMTNRHMVDYKGVQQMSASDEAIVFLKNGERKLQLVDFKKDWARYNYQWN